MSGFKELKSLDLASYTIISTAIAVLFSIIFSIVIVIAIGVSSPQAMGGVIFIIPTIIVGALMYTIYNAFCQGYLYNLLTQKLNSIKIAFKNDKEIIKVSTVETAIVISMIITIIQISQFAAYIVEDKFGLFTPFVSKYLDKTLDGHATFYEVQAKLHSGCLLLIIAAIMFFISSNVVMKICRNVLDERLPDKVKELLINEKDEEKINKLRSFNNTISYKNNNAERGTLLNNENSLVSNINNSKRNTKNNDIVEIED